MKKEIEVFIENCNPCGEARKWISEQVEVDPEVTLEQLWDRCWNPHWLIWTLEQVDPFELQEKKYGVEFARLIVQLVREGGWASIIEKYILDAEEEYWKGFITFEDYISRITLYRRELSVSWVGKTLVNAYDILTLRSIGVKPDGSDEVNDVIISDRLKDLVGDLPGYRAEDIVTLFRKAYPNPFENFDVKSWFEMMMREMR